MRADAIQADRVRELRLALGWTQGEAAHYVGRTVNHFAGYEQRREPVPLFVLRLLEGALTGRSNPEVSP